jgi:hypothetical protein
LEPEAITNTRIHQLRNRSISEYLIKWRKLPTTDSTLEDESFIHKHPYLLKCCIQRLSQGEGHVKTQIVAHYPLIWAYYISNVILFMSDLFH